MKTSYSLLVNLFILFLLCIYFDKVKAAGEKKEASQGQYKYTFENPTRRKAAFAHKYYDSTLKEQSKPSDFDNYEVGNPISMMDPEFFYGPYYLDSRTEKLAIPPALKISDALKVKKLMDSVNGKFLSSLKSELGIDKDEEDKFFYIYTTTTNDEVYYIVQMNVPPIKPKAKLPSEGEKMMHDFSKILGYEKLRRLPLVLPAKPRSFIEMPEMIEEKNKGYVSLATFECIEDEEIPELYKHVEFPYLYIKPDPTIGMRPDPYYGMSGYFYKPVLGLFLGQVGDQLPRDYTVYGLFITSQHPLGAFYKLKTIPEESCFFTIQHNIIRQIRIRPEGINEEYKHVYGPFVIDDEEKQKLIPFSEESLLFMTRESKTISEDTSNAENYMIPGTEFRLERLGSNKGIKDKNIFCIYEPWDSHLSPWDIVRTETVPFNLEFASYLNDVEIKIDVAILRSMTRPADTSISLKGYYSHRYRKNGNPPTEYIFVDYPYIFVDVDGRKNGYFYKPTHDVALDLIEFYEETKHIFPGLKIRRKDKGKIYGYYEEEGDRIGEGKFFVITEVPDCSKSKYSLKEHMDLLNLPKTNMRMNTIKRRKGEKGTIMNWITQLMYIILYGSGVCLLIGGMIVRLIFFLVSQLIRVVRTHLRVD